MFKVGDDFLIQTVKNLGRDEKSFNEDVGIVKKWIEEQPHFPESLDTRTVQNFLILNKFSIEKTKQRIDFYFTSRSKLNDIYSDINPKLPNMKQVREIMQLIPHPQLFNNNRVFFLKVKNKNLIEMLEPINAARQGISIQELRMRQDVMNGDIVIGDCTDLPLKFYLKFTPALFYKILVLIYEKVYSNRLKGFYITNFLSFGETLLNIIKKIAKPKIFERIHILPNNEALLQYFPEDFLPPEFGGKGIALSKLEEMLETELINHQKLYDHLDTLRVDEKVRPEALKNDEVLGFYGNFRKIDVD